MSDEQSQARLSYAMTMSKSRKSEFTKLSDEQSQARLSYAMTMSKSRKSEFSVMKKILICIQFLLLTTVAYATGQDSDVIYINGTRWALLDRPGCRDSLLYHHLKAVLPA